MFTDRKDAALQLATALEKYRDTGVVVLGVPRGGVETAYYVAQQLNAELSVIVCRKLGHPQNPEYAVGALAEDGTAYFTEAADELPQPVIDTIIAQEKSEIQRRIDILRPDRPLPVLNGKTVLLVDDGIATGATLFAAIRMCRHKGAGKIVVAAPVSAASKKDELAREADEVVILETPEHYRAVSQVYVSFFNLTDRQTIAFLRP